MSDLIQSEINYYHNDQWSVIDELGLAGASERLARMTLQVSPPFSISVNGKWGSGKTSIMRRSFITLGGHPASQALLLGEDKQDTNHQEDDMKLSIIKENGSVNSARKLELKKNADWQERDFKAANQSLFVWYSPWQHQNSENPLIPLLLEVRNQFKTHHKLLEKSKSTTRRGALAALTLFERAIDAALILTQTSKRPLATGTTEAVRKVWQDEDSSSKYSDGQRFHLQFEDAVETALASLDPKMKNQDSIDHKARLIVFIDDLDRCEEATVVKLLEAIKLYLGTSRCVFVLGLDNNAILHALGNHWSSRSEDYNREYLEKLFQATIRIPNPQPSKVKELIAKQFKAHGIPEETLFAGVVCDLIEPNPRKLKNFTNSICATWGLHNIPNRENHDNSVNCNPETLQLILLQYLVLYHPAVWRILERQPWALKVLISILTANESEPLDLPEGLSELDQHVMKHFITRSFSHVLKQEGDNDEKHRGLGLDSAVDLFLERIDRKRSDELFIYHLKNAFTRNDEVPAHLLTIGEI
ncbi:KAP family P-loop NTPase fold protein [Leucothrix pacifica]|uniref:KAP NTPase domain-containing protein n=1 Tax=Leucothrix pacifica TaxID=1247513 RepID=A0A317CLF2_9GAMM|nr:P-loop NTPase fold protein [Leucothrix pacifica]PWQ99189.1 hypothetical protein DKW60_07110 [Leucothrix pacifica]